MKKVLLLLSLFFILCITGVNAQTKKDGTPDLRFKENKEAQKAKPKLKADGTPDMRYKQNKESQKTLPSSVAPATGTPSNNKSKSATVPKKK